MSESSRHHAGPSDGFSWRMSAVGPLLESRLLATVASHAFTTRTRRFQGETAEDDYRDLATALGVPEAVVVRVAQVHGRAVHLAASASDLGGVVEADAVVSLHPGRIATVRTADCVPILLAADGGTAVAAVHAGWRGACAGVIGQTARTLAEAGVRPARLVAAIGPAIGPCCYQVGDEVRESFFRSQPGAAAWFAADGPGRWKLDLWQSARDQLVAAGVPADRIAMSRLCTAHGPDRWFSYRREGPATGRLVAAIHGGSDLFSTETG